MGIVSEFLKAITNLIEAEGRALRAGMIRFLIAVVLVCLSVAFVLSGFVLVVWGIYLWIATLTAPVWAALIAAAAALALGGVLIWEAQWLTR